jgi:hypothetical protein
MIGDGFCDPDCMNESCSFDGGDCEGVCALGCDGKMLGDGYCDDACNVKECQMDGGDCLPLPDGSMPTIYYADGRDYVMDYEEDAEEGY